MRRGDINLKKMLKRKSKGFTLVELLIVVIIIGILAGMMMLSTGSATAKAEATKIVSDMRNIKAAAVMYYADNDGSWTDKIGHLSKYLDGNVTSGDTTPQTIGKGSFEIASADGKLDIKVKVADTDVRTALGKMDAVKVASGDATSFIMTLK